MERLVCLALLCVASALANDVINPRGARPVEPGTRDEKCASQKEWPFCTDDDWNSKCPSGCRIQGLIDKNDHSLWKTIEKIRNLLEQNKAKYRSTDHSSKETFDFLKDKLIEDAGHDNNYYNLAIDLRQKIVDIKIKIDQQLRILAALKDRLKDQVVEIQRLEVDIDIKLRSCKGSCAGHTEYQVDKESYVALDKQISQLDNQTPQESTGRLYVMKSRPLQEVLVNNIYKSKDVAGQQREDPFGGVQSKQLSIEEDGPSATASPDTVCIRLSQQDQRHQQYATYARPRCGLKSAVPMCFDDDWVSKCPSGCRVQGLISQMETEAARKLRLLCKTTKMNQDATDKSMKAMTHIYNSNRRAIVSRHVSDLKFVELTERLSRNLTTLQQKSSRLSQQLEDLNHKVQLQVEDLYRTEVDVDMQLRACRGSCSAGTTFSVHHQSNEALLADMEQTNKAHHKRRAASAPPQEVPHVKLQPVDVDQVFSAEYKTIPTVQRQLLTRFEDIGQNQMVLEQPEADRQSALE